MEAVDYVETICIHKVKADTSCLSSVSWTLRLIITEHVIVMTVSKARRYNYCPPKRQDTRTIALCLLLHKLA